MKKNPQGHDNFIAILHKYFKKEDIFKIPNILCYMRVIFIIAFLCLYLIPINIAGNDKAGLYLACGVMATAVYTDFLDGFIARKFDQASEMGKILDPIADKLTQFAIALAIAIRFYQFPCVLILLALILIKEGWMFVAVIILARHNRSFNGAKWYGKLSTFLIYVTLGVILVCGPFVLEAYPLSQSPLFAHLIMDGLALFAIFFELFAFINYLILYRKLLKGQGEDEVQRLDSNDHKEDRKS